ncbi:hypothetical protein D3C87_361300 [compost metagenome]
MKTKYRILSTALFLLYAFSAGAQSTKVTIRALAKDAKFIGTGIGGALVTVRDHYTQELLAKGYTVGSSGDTEKIVKSPKVRYAPITDEATAKFVATVDVKEPTLVDIEVLAPFGRRNATVKSSTQIWVIPGKDILGDGIILEVPGFIVDILKPSTHQTLANGSKTVLVQAHVVLMCGCPVQKGGVWDSDNYEVVAILRREGQEIVKVPLLKASEGNVFEANVPTSEPGNYEVVVTAFDKKAYNTGINKISFVIK